MSGRQAPVYSDEQHESIIRAVFHEGMTQKDASVAYGVKLRSVEDWVRKHRAQNAPPRPEGHLSQQVADYAARVSEMTHKAIFELELKRNPDADELEKVLKVLVALDKLAKSGPPAKAPDEPTGKMAELASDLPDNG
jgi:transposase-like protein